MSREAPAVALSAVFVGAAGYALWPPVPDHFYWNRLPVGGLGDLVVLVVLFLAVAGGAAFAFGTGVGLRAFSIGGALAYAGGMVAIEAVLAPDSPVHLVLYGVLLGGFVGGAALARAGGGEDGGSTRSG